MAWLLSSSPPAACLFILCRNTVPAGSQGVAEAECRRAADAAEAAYVAAFKDVAADEAALDAEHQRSMAAARDAYAAGAMGTPPSKTAVGIRQCR